MSYYNINSIIPIGQINSLTDAYSELNSLGIGNIALINAYNRFVNRAETNLCINEDTNEQPSIIYNYKRLTQQGIIEKQAGFTFTKKEHFNLNLVKNSFNTQFVESFVKSVIMQIIKNNKKGAYKLCLIDVKNSGASFGNLISIVNSDYKNFYGKVFTSENDINDAFSLLEKQVSDNVSKSAVNAQTVYEYNKANQKKAIPITFVIIFDFDSLNNTKQSRFFNIEQNAEKAGLNIIKISSVKINVENSFNLILNDNAGTITKNDFKADVKPVINAYSMEDVEKNSEKQYIDTNVAPYFDFENIKFELDSTETLSIPFAIDDDGEVQSFEICGYAPSHALISGTTGSGKSVLLHTIIDSIMLHYHPKDVEIWAIDYKAVEFACYVENRTPHITVIGQDKSDDFSYSLLNLINKEYERRKKLFIELGVNSFNDCRAKGEFISRIVIVIDEFHNLTQAVQYNPEYKIMLENLLSEMRAMGMSFIFCSQTISNGLMGLTEKGRNQIGCRLCMKQSSVDEIKSTLADTMTGNLEYIQNIKNFGRGQVLYKKTEEQGYGYKYLNVLYFSDVVREKLITSVNNAIEKDYVKRHETICKNSERFSIVEKDGHTLNKFLSGGYVPEDDEGIRFFPAAPTTLDDEFSIEFERAPSSNMLVCVEDDNLRESIEIFSIISLLTNKNNTVNVSIFDTENSDCIRLNSLLSKICSSRLNVYFGAKESIDHILKYKKIKPQGHKNNVEFFYGINKIKSAVYVLSQHNDEEDIVVPSEMKQNQNSIKIDSNASYEQKMKELMALKQALLEKNTVSNKQKSKVQKGNENIERKYDFDEIVNVMKSLFEHGPDMGYYSFVVINNVKQLKQIALNKLGDFEYRIGAKMSGDDAYVLFASENFIRKADEKTVVLYAGSNKNVKTLRPYLLPDDEYLMKFNESIK